MYKWENIKNALFFEGYLKKKLKNKNYFKYFNN